MASLQKQVFSEAVRRLGRRLNAFERDDEILLRTYRETRQSAFEIEFLAKFYRKSECGKKKDFARVIEVAKSLEDRLGRLDEVDAMIPFCEKEDLHLPGGQPASAHFKKLRDEELRCLRPWLKEQEWTGGAELERLGDWARKLECLDDDDNREYARHHMATALEKLQAEIDDGEYDPAAKSGYRLKEIEPLVHKLRREIRKQAQYMSYTGGLFQLAEKPTRNGRRAYKHFAPLLKSPIAESDYSRLPKTRVSRPLLVPRVLFYAINRFVSELGDAKDWAFNLERLNAAGLKGGIDFNQLDVRLKNWRGTPVPFNALVLGILQEIRDTRPFAVMAEAVADS